MTSIESLECRSCRNRFRSACRIVARFSGACRSSPGSRPLGRTDPAPNAPNSLSPNDFAPPQATAGRPIPSWRCSNTGSPPTLARANPVRVRRAIAWHSSCAEKEHTWAMSMAAIHSMLFSSASRPSPKPHCRPSCAARHRGSPVRISCP